MKKRYVRRATSRNYLRKKDVASDDALRVSRDFYVRLGVPRSADKAMIDAAYRRLAPRYHSDLNPEKDQNFFRGICEAHETLADPDRRRKYDAQLAALEAEERRAAIAFWTQVSDPKLAPSALVPQAASAPQALPPLAELVVRFIFEVIWNAAKKK